MRLMIAIIVYIICLFTVTPLILYDCFSPSTRVLLQAGRVSFVTSLVSIAERIYRPRQQFMLSL